VVAANVAVANVVEVARGSAADRAGVGCAAAVPTAGPSRCGGATRSRPAYRCRGGRSVSRTGPRWRWRAVVSSRSRNRPRLTPRQDWGRERFWGRSSRAPPADTGVQRMPFDLLCRAN